MSSKSLTTEELRQWVLSLPPESIRSLEDTLKSIRDCHFTSVEQTNVIKNESIFMLKDKSEMMDEIDVSPPSRTPSPTSSNVSILSRSKSGKTYENGRRNLKEEDVSLEEAGRRAKRRERNRLAAAKCRKRRQDKIDSLQHRVSILKGQMEELNSNIDKYNSEQERLNSILNSHKCVLHQQSSSATRPKDLKIDKSQELSSTSSNVFICSLSPQLINLSPLFTPSTMKLLIDSINNQHSEQSLTPIIKEESLQNTSIDSTYFATVSTPSNNYSQSLSLLNLMSPNSSDLLNMNLLSSPSLKIAASLASTISSSSVNQKPSDHFKINDQS